MKIKNRYSGEIILEIEGPLSRADLSGANLSRANLSRAKLSGANLYGAKLTGADLSRADLSGADLSGANLYRAYLSGADLSRADLSRANLSRVDLSEVDLSEAKICCFGNMKEIHTMQLDTWEIGFTRDTLQIGCQRHSISDWDNFSDEEIAAMAHGALKWWLKWKAPLFAIINLTLKG